MKWQSLFSVKKKSNCRLLKFLARTLSVNAFMLLTPEQDIHRIPVRHIKNISPARNYMTGGPLHGKTCFPSRAKVTDSHHPVQPHN